MTKSIWVCAVETREAYRIDGHVNVVVPHGPDILLLYGNAPFSVYLTGRSREAKEIEMEFDIMPAEMGVLVVIPQNLTVSASVRVAPCQRLSGSILKSEVEEEEPDEES